MDLTTKKELIELQISYSIENEKLVTSVMYPENFLSLADMEKVQLLSSIIDTINGSSFDVDFESKSIEAAHDELVQECKNIFPFSSKVSFDLSNKTKSIPFEFIHDDSIHSLHPMHMVVIADTLVVALKNMAITIVKSADRK
ncbi:hypothetical protein [Pseudoalteromonas lipolytica]